MEQLHYLIAISEEKNITRAAEKLFVSQPALTRYIQKLEGEYGTQLLERSRNCCELTEAGILYLQEKTKIAAIEQNLRQGRKSINKKDIGHHRNRAGQREHYPSESHRTVSKGIP